MRMWRGWGWNFVCVRGLWKIGEVKGEGIKSGYRTEDLITWAGQARFAEIGNLVERNKNQLCDYTTTEPARLAGIQYCDAGIPGGNFPSYHTCRVAWRMNQARNRTAGNTLLMRIASNHYIKTAAPDWPFSCNIRKKVILAKLASPAHIIRPLLWLLLSRSLHVKALEFAAFGLVWENTTYSD